MTANVLIWGDTGTSPELRHEVPLAIGDPFLYLESDGRRAVVTSALEDRRIAQAVPDRALGGVRVEDLMVVTDDGAESLTGSFRTHSPPSRT